MAAAAQSHSSHLAIALFTAAIDQAISSSRAKEND